jgi:NADH dehydrogenase
LPDCIGRGIDPAHTTFDTGSFCRKEGIRFLNQQVERIDLQENRIFVAGGSLLYDYLIIASGSETNFYGNENVSNSALKLDDAEDAFKIKDAVCNDFYENYIISGGGYTGIEVATTIRLFLNKNKKSPHITIIERAPVILGSLPEWMKGYVLKNLERLKIDVRCATFIEKIEGATVALSSRETPGRSCVIWTAGVKTSRFLQELKVEKNPQGRVKVDEYLRLNHNCFVAGDASYVHDGGGSLRMAVQFAITQGESAARNCLRSIRGVPLCKYRPLDFGYIILMANNRACGRILGINIKGFFPLFMHYVMCIFRSYGFKNKWGIVRDLLKGGRAC